MDMDKRPPGGGDGCLVGAIRIPVKIVAVLVVLPVRVIWELLVGAGRALHRNVLGPLYVHVLEPLLRALGRLVGTLLKLVLLWPWVGLWRYVITPVGQGVAWLGRGLYQRVLAPGGRFLTVHVLRPLGEALAWVGRGGMRYLLAPLGRGAARLVRFLGMLLFVWPWVGLWRYVLAPVGRAIAWLGAAAYRYLLTPVGHGLVWLAVAVYRYLLRPVGLGVAWLVVGVYRYLLRPVGLGLARLASALYRYVLSPLWQVLVQAWHLAGRITAALWRGLRWVGRVLIGWPASRVYRHVLTPAGHAVREVWRTARAAVREARATVRRALFGTPPWEPARSRARTLGSTTAADAAPADEISLPRRRG
ncbi:hypothetical protein [Streptomyces sp. NRRL F-2664]|uniref:hypothetical protein n=1 Tax=Streptomyces sp. NRRL F-2664 TaxID=1463842 RepID=UPI0007C849A0|nr:hypothetical protein [Streptomyces sp. NRRL F-2664]